jgi:hypothetical protein
MIISPKKLGWENYSIYIFASMSVWQSLITVNNALVAWSSGIVSACHRGEFTYGSWDRIPTANNRLVINGRFNVPISTCIMQRLIIELFKNISMMLTLHTYLDRLWDLPIAILLFWPTNWNWTNCPGKKKMSTLWNRAVSLKTLEKRKILLWSEKPLTHCQLLLRLVTDVLHAGNTVLRSQSFFPLLPLIRVTRDRCYDF